MIAFASSLDQGGPIGKSAADLALLMNAMAGFDARDSTSLERPAEDYARELNLDLAGLRIGLPKEYFAEGVDADVLARVREAVQLVRVAGREGGRDHAAQHRTRRAGVLRDRARGSLVATCRASTACATATARRTTRTWATCTAARAPRVSAPR